MGSNLAQLLTSLVTPENILIVALFAMAVSIFVILRLLVKIDELWEYCDLLEQQALQRRLEEFTKGLKVGKHLVETQASVRHLEDHWNHFSYTPEAAAMSEDGDGWHSITMPTLARIEKAMQEVDGE